ncbi:MAG: protein-L-isoaspartate(D-aspartate) O-methyltransferase [Proteobacteria bacterium]|nr:protein-L-isoaspartate(D-aspartate) O-methyltransferase [Pseudomonadota bacterium]
MNVFSRPTPEAQGLGMTSQRARDRLIARLKEEGIADRRVLDVLTRLPRHLFVEPALESRAYEDTALPIGHGQTISQPWVVARMTEALIEAKIPAKVLEIGTGSGYQAAVLAALCGTVYTVERIESLLREARKRFRKLGIENIRSKNDDGRVGWPEFAPYDAIILTAAGEEIDAALFAQLAPDGVLVAPVGPPGAQRLLSYRREGEAWKAQMLGQVSFVPLLGGVA